MTYARASLIAIVCALTLASPALAAQAKPAATPAATPAPAPAPTPTSSSTPSTSRQSSGVQTPMDDLNLRKEALAPALQTAVDTPYSLVGLGTCAQLTLAVEDLNTALGRDIDLPQESGSRLAASDLMNFAASSVIPFRGLIREVTGASGRQRALQEAVLAGFARRSFLKGVGENKNCAYPARPANAAMVTRLAEERMASLEALCGPLPNGQKRTPREEWLNSRKCAEYKRAKADAAAVAPATTTTPAATRSN